LTNRFVRQKDTPISRLRELILRIYVNLSTVSGLAHLPTYRAPSGKIHQRKNNKNKEREDTNHF
jgi:hypothetical protein